MTLTYLNIDLSLHLKYSLRSTIEIAQNSAKVQFYRELHCRSRLSQRFITSNVLEGEFKSAF